jgi:hypothetical protein
LSSTLLGWTPRSSRSRHRGAIRKPPLGPSRGLALPFRVHPNLKRPLRHPVKPSEIPTTSSPEVSSPTASSQHGAVACLARACLTRAPAPSGFLNLLTLSTAPDLLALFHARSALGVHPLERFSSHAAVRRLRRRSPHVVGSARCDNATGNPRLSQFLGFAPASEIRLCEARQALPAFRVWHRVRVRHRTVVVYATAGT